ncbi:MAG: hypothetical protein MZV70_70580 [Desulfobacterales bacterium]|nr:hypothetical protein [Desulfobacterales bacterium]
MSFHEPVVLGRTGLKVGRLGIASGYKAPAAAVEEAFERGCNYFTWGTVIKGYVPQMREAIRNIVAKGQRDRLVLAAFTYAHSNYFTELMLRRRPEKRRARPRRRPHPRLLLEDAAAAAHRRGPADEGPGAGPRFIGISSHKRQAARGAGGHGGVRRPASPLQRRPPRGRDRDLPVPERGAGRSARDGVLHGHALGAAAEARKMPAGEKPPTAADCYRFVLSNPAVDVCMSGAKTVEQMRENLALLETGPDDRGRDRADAPHRRLRPPPQARLGREPVVLERGLDLPQAVFPIVEGLGARFDALPGHPVAGSGRLGDPRVLRVPGLVAGGDVRDELLDQPELGGGFTFLSR